MANEVYPVACRFGGRAPCVDDLCHGGGGWTLCGLDMDFEYEMAQELDDEWDLDQDEDDFYAGDGRSDNG